MSDGQNPPDLGVNVHRFGPVRRGPAGGELRALRAAARLRPHERWLLAGSVALALLTVLAATGLLSMSAT